MKTTNLRHTWQYAGVSRPQRDGILRFRMSNSADRALYLIKLGETAVRMVELPEPMDAGKAAIYLLESGFAEDQETKTCILQHMEKLK
ncbi:hypothetical protein UFOVP180_38 [uncultured Caudovirales phage]|uniref:Uncharacterized protein n=1 Tax=uncultured Caudovirales phage TaxID=2100421 RepID=A0A6J7WD61_9CAUD|nr:hypothetical protein UFOVP180_38 [uncultured Caudovirales phage]